MNAYLGPLGGLVPFKCPSSVDISTDRPITYRQTLGGRVKAFRGPKSKRSWSVGIGTATPSQAAGLQALLEYGAPPWVWVEPYAMVTNLFPPRASTLVPGSWFGAGTEGGAGVTADGTAFGRSINASGNVSLHARDSAPDRLPVVPGVAVTGSFYGTGTGRVSLQWINSAGVNFTTTDGVNTSGVLTRRTFSIMPPAGAVSVQIVTVGVSQIALPAYTFTDVPSVWSAGRGCNRALVEGFSEAVQIASTDTPALRRSSVSFTVREVG